MVGNKPNHFKVKKISTNTQKDEGQRRPKNFYMNPLKIDKMTIEERMKTIK